MKKYITNCVLILVLLTTIQRVDAQIRAVMTGPGKHASTIDYSNHPEITSPTLVLYNSSGPGNCEATVTFTNQGGPALWKVYPSAIFGAPGFPPSPRMQVAGADIILIPDPDLGTSYTHPGPASNTFTITLRSTSPFSGGFAIQANGANDIEVAFNSLSQSCIGVELAITVNLTRTSVFDCIAAGETFPGYNITVSDNLPIGTGPKTYALSLAGNGVALPANFVINSAPAEIVVTDPAAPPALQIRTATISGGLGNGISLVAATSGTFPFTLTATETGGGAHTGVAGGTFMIDPNCQKNVLVVKVDPVGGGPAWIPADEPMIKMADVKNWLSRASFGQAIFNPFPRVGASNAPAQLLNNFTFYNNPNPTSPALPTIPLVSLAQEVINKLLTVNATELDHIKHLILFLNTTSNSDIGPSGYWAVPSLTYDKPGGGKITLGVSIHTRDAGWKVVAHGVGHQFDLNDLTLFDPVLGVVNQSVTPIDYDIMAIPPAGVNNLKNIHPLTAGKFMRKTPNPDWIGTANSPSVEFIDNTTVSSITKTIIPVSSWAPGESRPVAIVLGLDNSSTTLGGEHTYIWIEARPADPSKDDVPSIQPNDLIVYYANKEIKDGVGQNMKWEDLDPGAAFQFSYPNNGTTVKNIGQSGWAIKSCVKSTVSGVDQYAVVLSYTAPVNTYDVTINAGTTGWTSPDIETVIPACKGAACNATNTEVQGLIAGDVDTRVNAYITTSAGSFTADVIVEFSISRLAVSGVADLSRTTFASVFASIPAGTTKHKVSAILNLKFIEGTSWGPTLISALAAPTSHYCLYVKIIPVTPGAGSGNKEAQKNTGFILDGSASPFPPIDYTFYVSNPDEKPRLILFNTQNIPDQWQFKLTPDKVTLNAKQEKKIDMRIEVPVNFSNCTDFPLQIGASMPSDHTLTPLGGIMTYVRLRQKTNLTIASSVMKCTGDTLIRYGNQDGQNDYGKLLNQYQEIWKKNGKEKAGECATLIIKGCTNPVRANEKITIVYQDPSGNPIYKIVTTDAGGCYEDDFIVIEGGEWTTTAIYPGDACSGSAKVVTTTNVAIAVTGDQDNDGLKDPDEVQGDDDNDNIPNQLDPDSDNDGIIDGKEPSGDFDCDGLPNVIDTDSDNDGIADGVDQTRYGNSVQYKTFFSAMFHRLDFDSDLPVKDGNGFNIRGGYNLHPHWGLEAEFGFTFTEDLSKKTGTVYNVNLNGLYYFNNRNVSPYLTAGAGALLFNGFTSSDNSFALNGGIGLFVSSPDILNSFALRAEIKGHYGFSGYSAGGNFNIQYSLGISYRIRTKSTPCKIQKIAKAAMRK